MASTSNTLPLAPHLNVYTGLQTTPTRFYETDDLAVNPGDILIYDATDTYRVDVDNIKPAEDEIIGVAMEPKASEASVAGDMIKVALALPGIEFSANMVDVGASGTDADTVASNATAVLCLGLQCSLDADSDGNVCVIRAGATAPGTDEAGVIPSRFAMQRGPDFPAPSREGAPLPRDADTLNPRVIFMFQNGLLFRLTSIA